MIIVVHNYDYEYSADTALVVDKLGDYRFGTPLPEILRVHDLFGSEDYDVDLQLLANASGELVLYFEIDPEDGETMDYNYYVPGMEEDPDEVYWMGKFPPGLYPEDEDEDELYLPSPTNSSIGVEISGPSWLLLLLLAVLIVLLLFMVVLYIETKLAPGMQLPFPDNMTLNAVLEMLKYPG